MVENNLIIERYRDGKQEEWDTFVLEKATNGTFLQTRRFLSYHPKDRFQDASYMIYDKKGNLLAVCPACIYYENGIKILFSHKGSTFGGLIVRAKSYFTHKLIEIIEIIEKQLVLEGFQQIYFKITPDIFSREKSDLLQYCLYYKGYKQYEELSLYVDLDEFAGSTINKIRSNKRSCIYNCEKAGLEVCELETKEKIEEFYNILCHSLEKYNQTPVHTLEELVMLKNKIVMTECDFYGVYLGNEMIAGSMVFYFYNCGTAHTQYLCAKREYNRLSPMSYLYYAMINEIKAKGFHKLSWGITTEHFGKELNLNLAKNKESFGSKHTLNRIFFKNLENKENDE